MVCILYSYSRFIVVEFAPRYEEATVLFKTGQDPVWHASALEGMATISVLDALSVGQGLVGHPSLLISGTEIVLSYPAILC